MSDNLNIFVALNLLLCAYNYVMRVVNKMSMMTALSLCVSCEFSRAIRILGRGPTFFSEQGPTETKSGPVSNATLL